MSFVVRPLGGDAPPRVEPPAPPFVDLDPHALPSWRKSKGGPGLLRAAPVTCAIAGVALALGLAINLLVGNWSEYPAGTVRASTVAFGGHYEVGLRNGDWERLFLAPLLLPDPAITLLGLLVIVVAGVSVERRLGSWRYGVLLGAAGPVTIAASLIRSDGFFVDRDPMPGLIGLFAAIMGARLAVARRFQRPQDVDAAKAALFWVVLNPFICIDIPLSTSVAGVLVGWLLGRTFLRVAAVQAAGPAGSAVRVAAVGLMAAWLAAAASTSVGLADRLAAAIPLDRAERFLSRYVREGDRSYRDTRWAVPFPIRPGLERRLDDGANAGARSDEERRLTTLLRRAVRFDTEADAKRKALNESPAGTRPSREDAEAARKESQTLWCEFYGACRENWARLRLRQD